MTAAGTAVVHGPRLQDYNPSDDATRPLRRELGIELIDAYGLRGAPGAIRVDPPSASQEDVERIHAPAYVRAVRRLSDAPVLAAAPEAAHWGLAPGGDTPARAGMHEAALAVCGASLTAASLVWEERALRAFCPAPAGLHHARAAQASGFCVYNDCALAIRWLLDAGAERVAYVDIDAHHGDGVQWLFYEEPRVLTCSVHESGRFLYPGTGGLAERGAGEAVGTAVNVPLPPFAGDAPYLRAIEEVIAPAVRRFRPDVLVTHQGADPHHEDPYSHLQVSLDGLRASYRLMNALAADAAERALDRPRRRRLQHRPAGPRLDAPARRDARGRARGRHPGRLARAGARARRPAVHRAPARRPGAGRRPRPAPGRRRRGVGGDRPGAGAARLSRPRGVRAGGPPG